MTEAKSGERDRPAAASNLEEVSFLRGANVLRHPDLYPPLDAPASQHASPLDQVVRVSVLGRPVLLPVLALNAGLSDLRLATGECVSLRDHTASAVVTFVGFGQI